MIADTTLSEQDWQNVQRYLAVIEEAETEELRAKVLGAGTALLMEGGMSRAGAAVEATRIVSGRRRP